MALEIDENKASSQDQIKAEEDIKTGQLTLQQQMISCSPSSPDIVCFLSKVYVMDKDLSRVIHRPGEKVIATEDTDEVKLVALGRIFSGNYYYCYCF